MAQLQNGRFGLSLPTQRDLKNQFTLVLGWRRAMATCNGDVQWRRAMATCNGDVQWRRAMATCNGKRYRK